MKLKFILVALTLTFSTTVMADATMDAIAAAKAAQKEASSLGFEWRDMGETIKKAEKVAQAGDDEKAIKLASIVFGQIKAIRKQAAIAKTAGPRF